MAMTNMDKRVMQFVKLRDEIKRLETEFEEKIAPYKKTLEELRGVLLNNLNQLKVESMRTAHGTVYKTKKQSCSIVDKDAFWNWMLAEKEWDLIDKRANAGAVAEYAEEHKAWPPGLNYSAYDAIGVRRDG